MSISKEISNRLGEIRTADQMDKNGRAGLLKRLFEATEKDIEEELMGKDSESLGPFKTDDKRNTASNI